MSRTLVVFLSSLALSGLVARALAQPDPGEVAASSSSAPPRASSIFPHQAAILEPEAASGLVRLALPPAVLEGARSDLGDVRIHDASGAEVPYAIVRGDEVLRARRADNSSRVVVPTGAETRWGRLSGVETYRIPIAEGPRGGGVLELVVEPDAETFVRDAVVRAEPATGEPREVAHASIFRFARGRSERLGIRLPGVEDGAITIALSGDGRPLLPRFSIREVDREVPQMATVDVPLAIRATRREGTRSIVTLDRPRGFPILRLVVDSATPSFARRVEVRSVPSGRVVGEGGLVRIGAEDVVETRSIALPAPTPNDQSEDGLELTIDDGDSPPLEALRVTAVLLVPSLVFDAGRARALRWGGHRAVAPRYDLMSQPPVTLIERARTPASLGPIEDNPSYDERPALEFALRPGALVDLSRYPFRAALDVPPSRDDLYEVAIPPALFAEAEQDLADLRIVDGEGRQWPYVFDAAPGVDELRAQVRRAVPCAERPGCSRYDVELPARVMEPTLVRFELRPRLLSRVVTVRGRDERGAIEDLGVVNLESRGDEPIHAEASLFAERVVELWLESDDGGETPLDLEEITLSQPRWVIRFVAPVGSLALVVGDFGAEPPSYDMARATELLSLLRPEPVVAGSVERNPSFREPGLIDELGVETVVLSVVLGIVVLVLFILTLRIARSPIPKDPEGASTAASGGAPGEARGDAPREVSGSSGDAREGREGAAPPADHGAPRGG